MSNDNMTEKRRLTIITNVCFWIVFFLVYFVVHLAVADTNSSTRLAFHEFYNQDKIDLAVIGPSRVYKGFYPELADQILGVNTFNMGTSSQTFDGGYYYLKELINNYKPEVVYFDVEFDFLRRGIGGQKSSWIISDYMRGINRYRYIFDVFDKKERPIMLSQIYRNKKNITWSYCKNNLMAKLDLNYWTFSSENKYYSNYGAYIGKGFVANSKKPYAEYTYFAYKDTYGEFDTVSPEKYNPETIDYLTKSIEICQKNGIKIVLITMPESNLYLSRAGDYQNFTDYINEIADKYKIEYYDFNLLVSDSFDDSEFYNLDHLTMEGAEHFTRLLCDLYKDSDNLIFTDSLNHVEKSGVIGVTYNLQEKKDGVYLLQWNIESYDATNYCVKIIQQVDGVPVFESEIIKASAIDCAIVNNSEVVMEIYDEKGSYLGNAILQ